MLAFASTACREDIRLMLFSTSETRRTMVGCRETFEDATPCRTGDDGMACSHRPNTLPEQPGNLVRLD